MKEKAMPASEASAEASPHKREDDAAFKQRWIPFGMVLKKKADGYGIDWRKMSMEEWFKLVTAAEEWQHAEDGCET